MRKFVTGLMVLFFISSCGSKQEEVERTMEDGVEVVINHLEPYKITGEPTSLALEEEFTIDFERDDLAEVGISEIMGFDVDSHGSIYIWTVLASENFIFEFDETGNFVGSFGTMGQGPGEFGEPFYLRIDDSDVITVADRRRRKIIQLNTEGELRREIDLDHGFFEAVELDNGNILEMGDIYKPETGYASLPIVLLSADLEEIKELQKGQKVPNWVLAPKINGLITSRDLNVWSIKKGQIFVSNVENGYEFLVYDFDGRLLRKIRKEYVPEEVPQEIKDVVMKIFDRPELQKYRIKEKVFFPEYMPPYQYFFTDDESRLFIMTCEKGKATNEYVYDIFNPDGFFIGRTSLGNFGTLISSRPLPLHAVAKKNKLYHLRDKESGYKELVVYKMNWE